MTLADLKGQLETEGEAAVEQVVAAVGEHWELVMAHCAFATRKRHISALTINPTCLL